MKISKYELDVFKNASLCRNFELEVFKNLENKNIKFPVYLSVGQEYIPASIATIVKNLQTRPLIFAQHRCHSVYLSFGGNIVKLIDELLGKETGCTYGMGGSASIHSMDINMYGHDGHMGTQLPIAVGACFSSMKPTVVFIGDSAAEEDYVLSALGWASTKNLPILFIVEDNNLSILTEKKVRRNWNIHDVAKSFKMKAFEIEDDSNQINKYQSFFFKSPLLLNIKTNRIYWHAGAGQDPGEKFDRYSDKLNKIGNKAFQIDKQYKTKIHKLWSRQLEKQ
tara:strand:- start:1900 stop:2739 length:840 start_codon:yes stop_codon:yes gene_type:complete